MDNVQRDKGVLGSRGEEKRRKKQMSLVATFDVASTCGCAERDREGNLPLFHD